MPSNNPHSFFMRPVTEAECCKLISHLKITHTGIDEIPVKVFKLVAPLILYPVTHLINLSFQSGIFPEILKIARITPVFKNGDKLDEYNYRPISSLLFLSKLFERCLYNRLTSFFEKFSLLYNSQYGFLRGKSTSDALVELTELIYNSLNEKSHHLSIFIDLKKAFDVVKHDLLLKKLEIYGIRGLPLELIKSYLSNRKSYVGIDHFQSKQEIINIGVPQGSILGPLLFLIYINDLPRVSTELRATLYADDTTLSFSHKDFDSLTNIANAELDKIRDWMIANRLTINPTKTDMIIFSNRLIYPCNNQIVLGNDILDFNTTCNYLGTLIDSKLNFSAHIQKILGKISRNTGIFYRIRDYMPRQARLSYYYAFIYPYLQYGIIIWGGTNDVHLKPLIVQQKRMIRNITNSVAYAHTCPLFKQLGLLKVRDIYKFKMLVHTHREIHVQNNFEINHSVNTRNRNMALPSFQRLAQTQRSVTYAGPTFWNQLPHGLRQIENLSTFKKRLKIHLLEGYTD